MILQSERVFLSGRFIPAQVETGAGKIIDILPFASKKPDEDFGENMLVPGFIDIHTHGAYGFSVDDGTEEGMIKWLRKLPEEGVTSVLPTTATAQLQKTEKSLGNIAAVMAMRSEGAQILGAHLEGPFIDETFKGAHDPKLLLRPSAELFDRLQRAANGCIRYLTLASELDEGFALIKHASANGVTVSIGHSGAEYESVFRALACGASCFTHSFNGMKGLHHREPGVAGAAMCSNSFAEIIADGYHVHPDVLSLFFKSRENSGIILVSDSMPAKGLPPGEYDFLNTKITMDENGTARISGTDTIAGSSLKINGAVRVLVQKAMVSIEHAILSATLNPARVLGLEKTKGSIKVGGDADLIVLDDSFNVTAAYCLGRRSGNR